MALSFQWDEIAFRKATAGWSLYPRMIYREIIPWLHLNEGSLPDATLRTGYKEFDLDRRTWKKWIQFLIDEGKLVKMDNGEWTNPRVIEDHDRITKGAGKSRRDRQASRKRQGHDMGATRSRHGGDISPVDNVTESTASDPLLQVTGIQDTEDRRTPPLIPPQGGCNQVLDFPPIPGFLVRKKRPPDFETWWDLYPRKVGKKAAERKYRIARQDVDAETLVLGLQSYLATKPADQAWCHPATWLHQGRWEDVECEGKGPPASRDPFAQQLNAIQKIIEEGHDDDRTAGMGDATGQCDAERQIENPQRDGGALNSGGDSLHSRRSGKSGGLRRIGDAAGGGPEDVFH